MRRSGCSRLKAPGASSSGDTMVVVNPADSSAAFNGTAVSRSAMVRRMEDIGYSVIGRRSSVVGRGVAGVLTMDELHRVLDPPLEHREPVTHAARAAGEIHDQRRPPHAGESAGKRRAGEARYRRRPDRLGDAGRLAVEHGAGRLGGHVARGESGAAGGERSEEHTSELQSHSFISYAVFCLKKKK